MEIRLAQLISDYQIAVKNSVLLMSQITKKPQTNSEWATLNIPFYGELKEGVTYTKHGFGCRVKLPEGEVDFDFGENGEIDGFDEWRLWKFCQNKLNTYGYKTQLELTDSIGNAVNKKMIIPSPYYLYYVVDSASILGEEAARILSTGCDLPHRTRDRVQLLSSQCFESANLMFRHYNKINQIRIIKGKLSDAKKIEFRVYLLSWLGYLNTTMEGFKNINTWLLLKNKRPPIFLDLISLCGKIGKLESRHAYELRSLRNDTFHLRTDDTSIENFFSDDGKRIEWARELHLAYASFFSQYRLLAEVHYMRQLWPDKMPCENNT